MKKLLLFGTYMMSLSLLPAQIVLDDKALPNGEGVEELYTGGIRTVDIEEMQYAVALSDDVFGQVQSDVGEQTPTAYSASPNALIAFLMGDAPILNLKTGFDNGFSFYYSNIDPSGFIDYRNILGESAHFLPPSGETSFDKWEK